MASEATLPRTDEVVLAEWRSIQVDLSKNVIIPDDADDSASAVFVHALANPGDYLTAGCDLSFFPDDPTLAVASLVVCTLCRPQTVVWEKHLPVVLTEPYIPQYLSFRELPGLFEVWQILETEHPEFIPRILVVMLDGNGILHPRRFGIAAHLGVVIQKPTIGVAKTLLWLPGFPSEKAIRDRFRDEAIPCHGKLDLKTNEGLVVGAAFRATEESTRPIFVSPGHMISVKDALAIVAHATEFRVPEPIRRADLNGRQAIRNIQASQNPAQQKRNKQKPPRKAR